MKALISVAVTAVALSGCASQLISDDSMKKKVANAIGVPANTLVVESRTEQTPNTYLDLKATNGQEYHCIINGGSALSMGMVKSPLCANKGDPINANPFTQGH